MGATRRVVVASKNLDKIREVESVLERMDHPWEIVRGLDWPDVDETEPTLEGNALLKAVAVSEATGHAAIADDTGLEVDALEGVASSVASYTNFEPGESRDGVAGWGKATRISTYGWTSGPFCLIQPRTITVESRPAPTFLNICLTLSRMPLQE